jgi:hypothetical protein
MRLGRKKLQGRQRLRAEPEQTPAKPAVNYRARQRPEFGAEQVKRVQQATSRAARNGLQRFGLLVLLVATLLSAVNILSLSGTAKVLPLTSGQSGLFLRDQTVYETAANSYLAGSIWNRNKITANSNGLSKHLLAKFPELAGVSVTVPLLAHRPLVYLEPAQPSLVLITGNGAFVVDTSGKALLMAASVDALNQPTLPKVLDQSGLQLKLGRTALPANTVSFIKIIVAQLAAKQLIIESMTLPAAASQLDVKIVGQPYTVKFNLQSNTARRQAGTFLATIARLQQQNITPAQYIDVRVDGRAYYQ